MKSKSLFLLILVTASFCSQLSAQVAFDVTGINGEKQVLIEQPDGSFQITENQTIESQSTKFISPQQSLTKKSQKDRHNELLQNGKTSYSVKFRLQGYSNSGHIGEVIIVNEELFYDRSPFSAGDDSYGLEGDMVYIKFDAVVEGNYHVMINNYSHYPGHLTSNEDTIPRFVFMEIDINRDIDTIIDLKKTARHKIYMVVNDETGQPIDNAGEENLFQYSTIDIQFPQGMAMKVHKQPLYPKYSTLLGSSFYGGVDNYFLVSDLEEGTRFSCTQAYLKLGRLYMASFPVQNGCTGDVTLTNIPDDFQAIEWIFNPRTEPASSSKYLTVHFTATCYRPDLYYSYSNYAGFGFTFIDTRYPIADGESLTCYLANEQWENDKTSAEITYWEGLPSHTGSNSNFIETPTLYIADDSIVFGNHPIHLRFDYTVKANDLSNPLQLEIGKESLNLSARTINNYFDPETIKLYSGCSNQLNSMMSPYERSRTNYELQYNDEVLSSGMVYEFPSPYYYDESGIYTLKTTNADYVVNDIGGEVKTKLTFDVSEYDADPPVLASFRIENEEGLVSLKNSYRENTQASVILSAHDYNPEIIPQALPIQTENIKVYYKSSDSDEWAELSVVERPDLCDTLFMNIPSATPNYIPYYYYSSELTPALADAASTYVDIKVELTDDYGNVAAYSWHPAIYVNDGESYSIPFEEEWNSGDFETNNWTFDPSQGNWVVTADDGNPAPTAKFKNAPPLWSTYSYSLVSPPVEDTSPSGDIGLSFDLYLASGFASSTEYMKIFVLNETEWILLDSIPETFDINWEKYQYDITEYAKGKTTQIRFEAGGSNSFNMDYWYIDNIVVDKVSNYSEHSLPRASIYPNPVTDILTIECPENESCRINILNALGKYVYTNHVTTKQIQRIDLRSLDIPDGVYFIQIISNQNSTTSKKIIFKAD
ncbi:MAG: T9SS type A sorting domain-containing protein [Bacteroidales bacterium]|nr:T9SS type A sorting domain-containing protein [Bacteroidales bacterium]MCF8387794.1 T9SS type A sorting domain-containing protein [Bacteroidales bacterium]MCF8398217.1 T9SS type A sorting domain-containing protein [Bacteroidales bacterium]